MSLHPVVYVYSDESGVFDKKHKDYFVYVGIVVVGQDKASVLSRKYLGAEKTLRKSAKYKNMPELKASRIENEDKRKLFRLIKNYYKFIVLVRLKKLQDTCFENKYSQQRYLDYAYKRGFKKLLINMDRDGAINLSERFEIKCYIDKRSTATNGKYSLRDSMLTEFQRGMYVAGHDIKPIARNLSSVSVTYCNSENTTLVRASDILANRALHEANNDIMELNDKFTSILILP